MRQELALHAKKKIHRQQQSAATDSVHDDARAIAKDLKLETVDTATLAGVMEGMTFAPHTLQRQFDKCMAQFLDNTDRHAAWCVAIALSRHLSSLRRGEQQLQKLFKPPYPFGGDQELEFLQASSRLGDELWEQTERVGPEAAIAVQAWEEVLRATLSTTRLALVMGSPDAGKTTFLQQVYNVEATSGLHEDGRTDGLVFYPHPLCDQSVCRAYIVDTPGYGDVVEHRNDTVRLATTCANALPGVCTAIWLMPASRALNSVADEVFKLLLPILRAVIVTKVDTLVEERWVDLSTRLWKEGVYDEAEYINPREQMMEAAKNEIEQHVKRLCGTSDPPQIVYTVLSTSSWGCTEPLDGKGKGKGKGKMAEPPRPPQYWNSAKSDMTEKFQVMNAAELRINIDRVMGIL